MAAPLFQEPRKMAWRYISTNSIFAVLLFVTLLTRNRPVVEEPPAD